MSQDYRAAATLDLSWTDMHRDAVALARKLDEFGPYKGIIAVARGGLVPAGIIANAMGLRVVDTVCIASYDERHQGRPDLLKSVPHDGEGWLVIDDLVDSGVTFRTLKPLLPRAHFATLYAKPKGLDCVDSYVLKVDQETWIIFPWEAAPVGV